MQSIHSQLIVADLDIRHCVLPQKVERPPGVFISFAGFSSYFSEVQRTPFAINLFQRQKIAALRSPAVGAEWILSNLSKALVLKFLSQASGLFDELCEQMPYIFQSIDLLVKDDFCVVHEGELICNSIHKQGLSGFDTFTNSVIQESKIYSDRQFLKEVISIV